MARPSYTGIKEFLASMSDVEVCEIFYAQKNIGRHFHDGSNVDKASIQDDWVIHVTKTPNGQWFTLNNRLLYAQRQCLWADVDPSGTHYMMGLLLPTYKVKIVPFKECAVEFRAKYTSIDNGNTCYIRRGRKKREKDWICAPTVNANLYKSYVVPVSDPTKSIHDVIFLRFLACLGLPVLVIALFTIS
jgi:hypothetical protein